MSDHKNISNACEEIFEQVHAKYALGCDDLYSLNNFLLIHIVFSCENQFLGQFINNFRRQLIELFVVDQFLNFLVAFTKYTEHISLPLNLLV